MAETLDASASTTKVITIQKQDQSSSSLSYPTSYSNIPTIPIPSRSFVANKDFEKILHMRNEIKSPYHSFGHNGILFNLTEKLTKRCEEFMKQFVKEIIEDVRQELKHGKTPDEIADILGGLNTLPSSFPYYSHSHSQFHPVPYNLLSASDYLNFHNSSDPTIQKDSINQEVDAHTHTNADVEAEEDDGIEEREDDEECEEEEITIKKKVEEMEVITEEFNGEKVYIPLEEPFIIYKREVDEDDNLSYFGDLVGVLDSDDIVWKYDGKENYYCSGEIIGTDDDKFEKLHKNPQLEDIIREKRGASIQSEPDTKEPIWGGYRDWKSIRSRK
jgi:hypothetical protein